MENLLLGNWSAFLLFLGLPILAFLILNFLKWKKNKKQLFAESRFESKVFFAPQSKFLKWIPFLYLIGFLFLIFSIMDWQGQGKKLKTSQKVRNVMFLLDVSNSMNVEDLAEETNRLEKAKNIIINTLPKLSGHRVGLVVFAGEAHSIMPLTTDFSSLENFLQAIETSTIKVQGTDFLKAMQVADLKFKSSLQSVKNVVLISDGEDNEGNDKKAIDLAQKENIRITSLGIGSEVGGAIPEYFYGQLMGYKTDFSGQTIVSTLQEEALKKMSKATGGIYIDGNQPMEKVVEKLSQDVKNQQGGSSFSTHSTQMEHYYQYFLVVVLVLFLGIYFFNPLKDLNL